jgi:hypothetical protein
MMMFCLSHHAFAMALEMRSNGPHCKREPVLAQKLSKLLKCIEFIDGTIIKICQPWNVKHIKFGSMVTKKKIVNRSFFSALIITSIMTILIPRKVGSLEPKDLISLLTSSTTISHMIMTKLYMK